MKRLFRIFKAVFKDIINDIIEYWNIRLHIWRIKQAIKIGKYYAIAGNKRVYILPDPNGKPTPFFKENLKDNVNKKIFDKRILEGTWLLDNAIEIIDNYGNTLLNKNHKMPQLEKMRKQYNRQKKT